MTTLCRIQINKERNIAAPDKVWGNPTQKWILVDDNTVVGSDFNCPLDKKGGILIPRQHVINSTENVQNEFSLHDIWRIKNPNTRSFTWSKNHPFIFCRLDYWLISDKLKDLVTQVDVQASIKTDHSSILLELEDIKEG